jgi:hypothetical protein
MNNYNVYCSMRKSNLEFAVIIMQSRSTGVLRAALLRGLRLWNLEWIVVNIDQKIGRAVR